MDPSSFLCGIYDNFTEPPPKLPPYETWYFSIEQTQLSPFNSEQKQALSLPSFIDEEKYQLLLVKKGIIDQMEPEAVEIARSATNPFIFESGYFEKIESLQLANLDAVHHVLPNLFTFLNKTSPEPLSFIEIGGSPDNFLPYLQYRYPNAHGFGWNKDEYYGYDDRVQFPGTLFHASDEMNDQTFRSLVTKEFPIGVDLFLGHQKKQPEDPDSFQSLVSQVIMALETTKVEGSLVLKIFDSFSSQMAQLIYLIAQCFHQIILFKPITSAPDSPEQFLIGKGKKRNLEIYRDLLDQIKGDQTLPFLFREEMDPAFIHWLNESNNRIIDYRLEAMDNIIAYSEGQQIRVPYYEMRKFYLIWNLPTIR
jgi:hypothetical protein